MPLLSFLFPPRARPAPVEPAVDIDFEPPASSIQPSPNAAPVHVLSGEARIRVNNGVVRIETERGQAVERPIEWVSSVHIHGHASISSPAVAALVQAGAPVLWRGHHGYPIAIAQPMSLAGLACRRAQYAVAANPATRLKIGRAFVAGKIIAMRGVLRRRIEGDKRTLNKLAHFSRSARLAKSPNEALGYEGAASALYFSHWSGLLRHRADALDFPKRTRRPPMDEPNALLSYFYAVLAGECVCAAAAAGLDPRLGFLHEDREGRPSLALDLLELVRASVADTAALMALNTGEVSDAHFAKHGGGCGLTEEGRRAALRALERRLDARCFDGPPETVITWRAAIELEARRLRGALISGAEFMPGLRP